MEPTIKKIIIKRFRSFPSDYIDFDNPTFFIGQNGAGKSNFVDIFAFLSEAMALPLQAVFDRRGGVSVVRNRTSGQSYPPNLGLGVIFGKINDSIDGGRFSFEIKALPNYGFQVIREQCTVNWKDKKKFWFDRKNTFSSNVEGLKPSLDPNSLSLPVVGGDDRFSPILKTLSSMRVYSIEPSSLREMQDPDSGTILKTDGSNAASVLQELNRTKNGKEAISRIWEILESIIPNTKQVRSKKHGNKLSLEFIQDWGTKSLKFEAFNMSDGTLRALGLLLSVFQSPKPSIIAIEEPEETIHPGALGAILDLIKLASKTSQVLVTTHSPELLDVQWIKDHNLRIVKWEEGASHVLQLSRNVKEILKQHLMGLGDLFRANSLDSQPLFERDPSQQDLFEQIK